MSHAQTFGFGLEAGAFAGVTERWSVGISGSLAIFPLALDLSASSPTGTPISTAADANPTFTTSFIRVDGDLRYHLVMKRMLDIWGGPVAGVGFASLYDHDHDTGMRPGPHLGGGVGLDFLPFAFVSIGVAARGGVLLLSVPSAGSQIYSQATVGAVLGFHVPSRR